jgi:hypothetical protein
MHLDNLIDGHYAEPLVATGFAYTILRRQRRHILRQGTSAVAANRVDFQNDPNRSNGYASIFQAPSSGALSMLRTE